MINETILERVKDSSLLLIRLGLVTIFLYHGFPKATEWPMAYAKFESMGFPGFLGPVVGIAEVIAATMILVGYWNLLSNFVLAVIIFVAARTPLVPSASALGPSLVLVA